MAVVEHTDTDAEDATYRLAGRTTITLESEGGHWRATQPGVDAVGYGETAAEATTAFCRRIAATEG